MGISSSRHSTPLITNTYYERALGLYDKYMKGEIALKDFTDFVQTNKEKLNVIIQDNQTYESLLFEEIAGDFYGGPGQLAPKRQIERNSDCIQAMLELGADPNQIFCYALSETKEKYDPRLAAECFTRLNTMLHWLIANDHPDRAIKFINMRTHPEREIDLNALDNTHKTPLLFIVGRKYFYGEHGSRLKVADQALIEELVRRGADINIADAYVNTPLHIACVKRDVDAVKALLSSSTLNSQSLKNTSLFGRKEPIDMLDLSYDESRTIIRRLYTDENLNYIIQERTVNSPEAKQNAEQIRQLILDKQNELELGTLEESSIRAEFIGGHNKVII